MQILPTNGEIILGNNVQLAFTQAPLDSAGCHEVGGGIIQYIDTSIHSSTYSWEWGKTTRERKIGTAHANDQQWAVIGRSMAYQSKWQGVWLFQTP